MVVQKAINNLRERPKEERSAVAGGIAVAVVIILFLAWAILFFKRIQDNRPQIQPQDTLQQVQNSAGN